jgi:DNA invertase Pin-like site-specific DNA recombinase
MVKFAIYVRTSKTDQILDNQKIPLIRYAEQNSWQYEVFEEQESTRNTRPIQYNLYNMLLKRQYEGVLIYKFDRWARSSRELVTHLEELQARGIRFISFTENIDTSTPMGKAMFTIISAMAELERGMIRERTMAGLARGRAWGKILGRHPLNCGCGASDIKGNKHNGYMKPIRDESNKIIGWKDERTNPPINT